VGYLSFVDPIADIAVLGSPNAPHADDYKAVMATALPIADRVRHPVNFWAPARLLSLDGRGFSCTIRHFGGPLWITHAAERGLGDVWLADRRGDRDGDRGRVHHHVAREGGPPRSR
jgi:hypothetical protein